MKCFNLLLFLLVCPSLAFALTPEEQRIRDTYGPKYNVKAVIKMTGKCVEQQSQLTDYSDLAALQTWCEQQVINGWKPLSEAEFKKRLRIKNQKVEIKVK